MDLNSALNSSSSSNFYKKGEDEVIYFDGSIVKDDEEYFRLYLNPKDYTRYFRIKNSDVVGEIHEYSEEYIEKLGIAPTMGFTPNNLFKMFQIPVKKGTDIEFIQVQKAKVGVRYPKESVRNIPPNKKSTKQCTCQTKGKNSSPNLELHELGYCDFSGVCSEGCIWRSPYGSEYDSCNCLPGCTG